MNIVYFQAVLTIVVLVGGGHMATRADQPIEVRMAAAALVSGSVFYWFKSPLEDKGG